MPISPAGPATRSGTDGFEWQNGCSAHSNHHERRFVSGEAGTDPGVGELLSPPRCLQRFQLRAVRRPDTGPGDANATLHRERLERLRTVGPYQQNFLEYSRSPAKLHSDPLSVTGSWPSFTIAGAGASWPGLRADAIGIWTNENRLHAGTVRETRRDVGWTLHPVCGGQCQQ